MPAQTVLEARTQLTFNALMWALSTPGTWQPLPADTEPFMAVAETLLDLETRFFTPDVALHARLPGTGAHPAPAGEADYLFFPELTGAALVHVRQARRGDALYPDHAATLIVSAGGERRTVTLSGPGLACPLTLSLALPGAFWTARQQALAYPLGWDVFVVDNAQVLGLPRTTHVEVHHD